MHSSFLLLPIVLLLALQTANARHLWSGANCYFLHGLPSQSCTEILQAAQAAELKTIRIFIASVFANSKNTGNAQINDVESYPGTYDDTILNQIDDLMYEAYTYGIKLIIAMHDRYAMTWPDEAYVKKYNIPTNPNGAVNDASTFYTSTDAQADFDKRLSWILWHQNPHFGGRRWYEINEAIFSFEAENEAMGHMNYANANWHCDRAKVIKGALQNGILVSNGGGIDFPTSLKTEFFQCPYIDVICLHTYDYDTNYIAQQVTAARNLAWQYGKRVIVEEFGAISNQETELAAQIQAIQDLYIPWMFWEVMKPGSGGQNFEIWADENVWWSAVNPNSKTAANTTHGWSWPEIWTDDSDGDHSW